MTIPITQSPDLLKEWHPTKNLPLTPENTTTGSGKKVWWLGACGHEWEARIAHRSKGSGCPVCKTSKIIPGFNDLASTFPELAAQWHPTKNLPLTPNQVSKGSRSYKIWWLGECKHEWEATVLSRTTGTGCPYCSGNKVLPGFNDLKTTHPHLKPQWNTQKNSKTIEEVSAGSKYKASWVCEQGHEWETTVKNRTLGRGCHYCSNFKRLDGLNDLKTLYPHIAQQWNVTRNMPTLVTEVSVTSPQQVWWICEKNHEWLGSVENRTRKGNGCPTCYATSGKSQAEEQIYNYLSTILTPQPLSRVRHLINFELDIYVPEKQIAIEFNGLYWHDENHKPRNYHYDKWLACKEAGIQLIQVWEDEWQQNPQLIKTMLSHKLGVSLQPKIYARNTEVREITQQESEKFFKQNHIQGVAPAKIKIGLFQKNHVISALSTTEPEAVLLLQPRSHDSYEIIRYATKTQVVGGFSKLLKFIETTYSPTMITTFSDNCVSNGELYKTQGFVAVKSLPPDYKYVVKGQREHKFRYRLKKFKNDSTLKYEKGLTEKELAVLNHFPRIWDAGKIKWVKVYKK